jgi:oligopeptide transport system ATP-binding protein
MSTPILNVSDLETQFKTPEGIIHAVNGVSFSMEQGETIGIVGESGCGKSVTMLSILRLIPSPPGRVVSGKAFFRGRDLLSLPAEEMRQVRGGQIAMVFQDPMTSFNPVQSIGTQLEEPLILHRDMSRRQARARAIELLSMVGIPHAAERMADYPHQFSGGMRQRVMIAMALSCDPQILIADEPTTALDVTIQAQITELVKELRDKLGMAIIWITHDLGVIARLARRVSVMYGGFIIEQASVEEIFAQPRHPYTIGLLGSLPRLDSKTHQRLKSIEGAPPVLYAKPTACPFRPRCQWAVERCRHENPSLHGDTDSHKTACWIDIQTGREN